MRAWLGYRGAGWVFALPLAFIGLFFFYPMGTVLYTSLFPSGTPDLSGFAAIFGDSYYRGLIAFTAGQAALSTLLTLVLALPAAYVFARLDFRGKTLLLSLITLPFVLPTVVVAAAFKALLGERGVINALLNGAGIPPLALEETLTIILIAHVFYNFPLALRMISSYWAAQSERIEEAARTLGAHGWRLWWYVRLPLLRPAIASAALLVFIFTFTSFGVIVILGGARFATIEVEIVRQARDLLNLPLAGALSVIQIGAMAALMFGYSQLQARTAVRLREGMPRAPRNVGERLALASALLLVCGLLLAPLLALIWNSVTFDGTLSLRGYSALGSNPRGSVLAAPPLTAIGNSLVFAGITTLLALLLGTLTALLIYRAQGRGGRIIDAFFMLPLATSAVTLGFGFLLALDRPPLNLRASPLLIPIAHTLVALPFVVRSVLPALQTIPRDIGDAARTLGATPGQVWRSVTLPLISRGMLVGAVFAFTVSVGEFGASLFIARPNTPTIPLVIYRLLSQPGAINYGQALAMSVILMGVCALAFILIERARELGVGEF